jgi:hypothetical protein
VTGNHLKFLVKSTSKAEHMLTESDVNGEDGMNYAAVEKFADIRVENCLAKYVPGSEGTVLYLKVIRNTLIAFTHTNVQLENRLYHIWYAAFVLRGWREWIIMQSNVTVENFVTANAYTCIELNAHALVQLIMKLEQNPELCLPTLCNSQHCEGFFRFLRSMTSSLCTVVNFSIQDVLNRVRRVNAEEDLSQDLKETFVMPVKNNPQQTPMKLPDKTQIQEIVEKARLAAVFDLQQIGIISNCYACQLSGNYEENICEEAPPDSNIDIDEETEPVMGEDIVDDLKIIISNCPNSLCIPHVEDLSGKKFQIVHFYSTNVLMILNFFYLQVTLQDM